MSGVITMSATSAAIGTFASDPTTTDLGHVVTYPVYAGQYWLGGVGHGFGFALKRRPFWVQRFLMKHLLGWVWRDTP